MTLAQAITVPAERTRAERAAAWMPELDGPRAIACLAVLFAHFNLGVDYKSPALVLIKSISPGNTGVILFFVLSSFLITSISIKQWQRDGKLHVRRFWARRAFRILPLYFAGLALTYILIYPGLPIPQLPGAATSAVQWDWALWAAPFYATFVGNWLDARIAEVVSSGRSALRSSSISSSH